MITFSCGAFISEALILLGVVFIKSTLSTLIDFGKRSSCPGLNVLEEKTFVSFCLRAVLLIKLFPPRATINSKHSSTSFVCLPNGALLLASTFFVPSSLNTMPWKWTSSFFINAKAPIGALQPPSNLFRNVRSMFVQISVSSWLSALQASMISLSDPRHAIMIAPCAGAGTIHSKLTAFSGVSPIRPSPAAAKTAPFQFFEASNFCSLVLTLPLNPSIVCVG